MPRQLMLSRVPVDLSIVEFSLNAGEDIFLTYTWQRSRGPQIKRTGKGPPGMSGIGFYSDALIVHPFALRQGTWLIQEDMRKDEKAEAKTEFDKARKSSSSETYKQLFQDTLEELDTIQAHDTFFKEKYPGYEVVGMQGCGDLTMNLWNVAFINNDLGQNPPVLVCLREEDLESRTYSCLVKWKGSEVGAGRVTIEEVKFYHHVREQNEMIGVRFGSEWLPRGDLIDFAVSNQQVIRNDEIVPVVTTCYQFGDLRHLLRMPNLNPEGPLYPGEPPAAERGRSYSGEILPGRGISYRPREYFGENQSGDIWLGEEALLSDTTQNLLRAALTGPVFLSIPAGANKPRLRGALTRAGYREISRALQPLSPGDWRFVRRGPQQIVLEIYFERNVYGWTMIGLSADNRRILSLACTGKAGQNGYTLEQAAELLLNAGASNALLVDEGNDVFQKVLWSSGGLVDMVPSQRRRLRATLIFAHPSYSFGCTPSPPSRGDSKLSDW